MIVLGSQLLWDIPATICVPSIFSRLMLTHHIVLTALTPFVMFTPYVLYYVPFYGDFCSAAASVPERPRRAACANCRRRDRDLQHPARVLYRLPERRLQ